MSWVPRSPSRYDRLATFKALCERRVRQYPYPCWQTTPQQCGQSMNATWTCLSCNNLFGPSEITNLGGGGPFCLPCAEKMDDWLLGPDGPTEEIPTKEHEMLGKLTRYNVVLHANSSAAWLSEAVHESGKFIKHEDIRTAKETDQEWLLNVAREELIVKLHTDVEKLKEEYKITEAARSSFERTAVANQRENVQLKLKISQLSEELEKNQNLAKQSKNDAVYQEQIKSGEALSRQMTEFKVECLKAQGRSTVMTANELGAYNPASALREITSQLDRAKSLLERVASGESYYPNLEKDIFKFTERVVRPVDSEAPNHAMWLLNQLSMGCKSWSYSDFGTFFETVDKFLNTVKKVEARKEWKPPFNEECYRHFKDMDKLKDDQR